MKMSDSNIFFLSEYTGTGASKQEFIDYFKSKKIKVIFESDIDSYISPKIQFEFLFE